MTQAKVISVNPDRQLELPEELLQRLHPGDEYLLWQTEDTILLKKIYKPAAFEALMAKVEALGPDPEQLSMQDITALVKEVRHESSKA
jgi:hypothetical protein